MLSKQQTIDAIQKALIAYKKDILDSLYTNQNTFSDIKVDGTSIASNSITDTLNLISGDNIKLTPDANKKSIALSSTDSKMDIKLDETSKAYLVGVTTTPTSTAQSLTGVSDTGVYLDTTAGQLTATKFKGSLEGNASSADKLNNQLNIVLKQLQGGPRTSFNGSSEQTVLISPTSIGAATEDHTHKYAGSSNEGGAATSAEKLSASKKIGFANFDGSTDIGVHQIFGEINTTSSGIANKNKWTKIASINISEISTATGKIMIDSAEAHNCSGILYYSFRTSNSETTVTLNWLALDNISYSRSVAAVKTDTGKYDIYFKPLSDWNAMNITFYTNNSETLTTYSLQGYVDSIEAEKLSNFNKSDAYINVKSFGIVGDGVTDNTSILTSLISSGYTNLFFPNGTYLFNISISSIVRMIGESKTKTIFTPAVDNKAVIELDSSASNLSNFYFCNFTILNNSDFTGTEGIKLIGSYENDRHVFRDIIIDNGFLHSISMSGRSIWNLFENIWINKSLHSGIYMTGETSKNLNTFNNITIRNGKRYAIFSSVTNGSTDTTYTYKTNAFISCNFENNCTDTSVKNQAAVFMYNLDNTTFLNCYIENNKNSTSTCYGIMSNGRYTRGLCIQGCLVWGQDYGIYIDSVAMSGSITGNRMANNTSDITIGSASKAGTGNEETNMLISGNTLKHQFIRNKDINSNSFVSSTNPFSFPYRHANNSATPDVKNCNIVMCWTTEDVTNFTNGIDGQILTFRFYNSSSTKTIKSNTNIKIKDNKDAILSNGDTITFMYYNNQWVEIARSSSGSNAYSSITFNGTKAFEAESPEDSIMLYSGDGIGFSASDGLYIENTGVLEISTGSTDGTISVNTGGTSKNVAVKGLGSAAYTASTDYANTNHTHGLINNNFTAELENTTDDYGWAMIDNSYTGTEFMLKSLKMSEYAPSWLLGNHASGIAFGSDTMGVMSISYSTPDIKFAGGDGNTPLWNMEITGSSDTTYNLDNFATKDDIGNIGTLLDELNGTSI